MKNSTLPSPYPGPAYGAAGTVRVTMDIPRSDYDTIRICGGLEQSFVQNAIKHFVKHLSDHCNKQQWTLAHKNELTAHILHRCAVDDHSVASITSQRPAPSSVDEVPHGHDGRRTRRVGSKTAKHPNEHAVIVGDETKTPGVKAA